MFRFQTQMLTLIFATLCVTVMVACKEQPESRGSTNPAQNTVVSEEKIETNVSTNPVKVMFTELKLPNYDTALDMIDYSVPYDKIEWPWKTDPERQEKRIEALKKLVQAKAPYYVTEIVQHNPKLPLRGFGWNWGYDEIDWFFYADGDNVTDDLLFEVLPYTPEVESCGLDHTKVTDEGLKAFFYLPTFKGLGLTTVEPDTHPLQITDKGIEIISKHPTLESIGLRNVRITDESFKSLARNAKKLRKLSYTGDGITSHGLEYMKETNSLLVLSLTNTNVEKPIITAEILDILAAIPRLQRLTLDDYDLSAPPDERMLASLKKLDDKLISLNFRNSKVHPKLLEMIRSAASHV